MRAIFHEVQGVSEDIQGIVNDVEDISLEQTLEGANPIGAAEDLIEQLIDGGSAEQSDPIEDNLTPNQVEDTEFRDLLQELLQD